MRPRRGLLWIAASFAVMLAAVTGGAGADALAIDFESGYMLGPVWGQNGWTGGACGPHDIEVADNSLHAGAPSSFGTKSYRISNAFTNGCFNDSFTPSLADEAGESTANNGGLSNGDRQPVFDVEFIFASSTGALQPGLNVQVSPDRGDGARMSFVRMRHTATELEFEFFDVQGVDPMGPPAPCFQCANFVSTVFTGYDPTVAHTVRLRMQFVDGESNDIVDLYIDDVLVHTGGSWEDYYTMDTESSPVPPRVSRTVDSLLIRSSGTAVAANLGKGYLIDAISLESGPLPPPPTTCGDPDGDGDNHSNFAPDENEDGQISGTVHDIDQAIVIPVVTADGGVVPELNCAVVKGVLGL